MQDEIDADLKDQKGPNRGKSTCTGKFSSWPCQANQAFAWFGAEGAAINLTATRRLQSTCKRNASMQIFDGMSGDARERLKLALMERKRDKWVKAANKSMWLARKFKLLCGCGSPPWTEAKRKGARGLASKRYGTCTAQLPRSHSRFVELSTFQWVFQSNRKPSTPCFLTSRQSSFSDRSTSLSACPSLPSPTDQATSCPS
jgi:hypothetical protein